MTTSGGTVTENLHRQPFLPPYRAGTPADAEAMAELVNFAGEGLPVYLWTNLAEPEQSPWDVGRRRACRDNGAFSYRNTVVREEGGCVVACLIGYPLAKEPDPSVYDDLPAMFVPMQQLEDLAAGTWYVNVLAAYPNFRGKGYGAELLRIAERLAECAGRNELSIIVSDANSGARRLYERCGYRERAKRGMVKDAWDNPGKHWVLLTKSR